MSLMTLIITRPIIMKYRLHCRFHLAAVLIILLPKLCLAQVNMQQMPNYPNGTPSAAAERNRIQAPAVAHTSGLMLVPEDFAKLKLAPGFLLHVNVLQDSDFTGDFRVDERGDIAMPILGILHIGGKTAFEAREQIEKRLLEEQILKNPEVVLSVLEYTSPEVTIIGEVTSPGKYPLLVPRKLVDVLALAGGATLLAGNEVQITPANASALPILAHFSRAANPKTIEDILVRPGDTVQVQRAGIVYVLGAVNRPGGYVMQENGALNVLEAISLASGTSVSASTGKIYLLRRNPDGTEVDIPIPYKKMTHGKQDDMELRAKDVLYVPTSAMKSLFTNSQGILAAAASASIYAGVIY